METTTIPKNGSTAKQTPATEPHSPATAITPFEPRGMEEALKLADQFAKSNLLPAHLRGKPADVLVTLLSGRELGFSPLQSVRAIYVVEGKPTLAAEAMVALCKRQPEVCEWFRLVESTPQRATYETKRKGEPEPTRLTFTIEDANRAGVTGKAVWKNYPAAMLRARCASGLARAVYPELLFGCYDPEELGAPTDHGAAPPPPMRDVTPPPAPKAEVQPAQPAPAKTEPHTEPITDAEFTPAEPPMPTDAEAPADIPEPEPTADQVTKLTACIEAAKTQAELAEVASLLKDQSKDVRDALRPLYTARHAFLSKQKGSGKS
jgi:hypothetical protein